MFMEALISKEMSSKLNILQQEIFANNIPVVIVFEGSSGRVIGRVINELIRCLEPRGVNYVHIDPDNWDGPKSVMECLQKTPAKGMISLYDRSWYSLFINTSGDDQKHLDDALSMSNIFEKYLTDNGVYLIKVLLIATTEVLKKYGDQYGPHDSKKTFLSIDHIDPVKYRTVMLDHVFEETDTIYAPWDPIAVDKIDKTVVEAVAVIQERLLSRLKHVPVLSPVYIETIYPNPRIGMDLNKECLPEYREKINKLSDELAELQVKMAESKRSLILGFEGWDAAGKGSAIKHICHALNPRGYVVHQTKPPTEEESAHTYLWRFCDTLPDMGHIAIYDRTWYGRMMVEPIEGFCMDAEYLRAPAEINNFEHILVKSGAIILKFWLDISPEVQLMRFQSREEDPLKQWKITDEDWRNRDKWDEYDTRVNKMIESTNTPHAPWIVVESNDKRYARLKILKTIVDAIKEALDSDGKKDGKN